MPTPERPKGFTVSATEGLPAHMVGRAYIAEWVSKAVIHKKLQTLRLIHDSDVAHIIPAWQDIYDVVEVVVRVLPGAIRNLQE